MTSILMMSTLKPREVKRGKQMRRVWVKPGSLWTSEVQLSRDLRAWDIFLPCHGSSSLPWMVQPVNFKVFPESRSQDHLSLRAALHQEMFFLGGLEHQTQSPSRAQEWDREWSVS